MAILSFFISVSHNSTLKQATTTFLQIIFTTCSRLSSHLIRRYVNVSVEILSSNSLTIKLNNRKVLELLNNCHKFSEAFVLVTEQVGEVNTQFALKS
jgi:DNA-binding transcriptional regulator WhiA